MLLQHSSVRKSLHWDGITIILSNSKVGIFPLSYTVIPSFILLLLLLLLLLKLYSTSAEGL